MSARLLIQDGASPEVPAHALEERVAALTARGWDARLLNGRAINRTPWGRPRVVHFASGPAAVEGITAARRARAAAVVTFSGEDLAAGGLAVPGYYDEVWRNASAIHLSDERVWRRALARGCPESMPRAVIGPASTAPYFASRNGSPHAGPLRLLSVGPLRWSQGHEHALHALRLMLDRGVECRYRIVGSGEYGAAVAFARYQLGLEERVELVEPGSASALRAEYERADVFVCAAVVEGTPRALVDAQAMALPAVVSDAGRDADFLDGSGLVVGRRDPHALADALEQVAGDAGLRRQMGARARERAEAVPAGEQLHAFEALYRSLV